MALKISGAMVTRGGLKYKVFSIKWPIHIGRTNIIEMLNINGAVSTELSMIKEYVAGFYEQLVWRPKIDGLAF